MIQYIICCLLLMVGVVACSVEDSEYMQGRSSEDTNLVISVKGLGNKTLSRADDSNRTDMSVINNMYILLVNGSDKISHVFTVDKETPDPGREDTGLMEGTFPTDSPEDQIKYHLTKEIMSSTKDIYVLCNYMDGDVNIEDLQGQPADQLLNLNIRSLVNPRVATLFGKAERESVSSEGTATYKASLKRTVAMITVEMRNAGLKQGVSIHPTNIRLFQIPSACTLKEKSKIGGEIKVQSGADYPIDSWGEMNSDTTKPLGGHTAEFQTLYMYENCQGEGTYNDEQNGPDEGEYNKEIGKTPAKGNEENCSYLEITATYNYAASTSIMGTIKYRLWLGNDIYTNFDVERNTHYRVTLFLKGMGGLVEDGKTDKDGNLIADGPDLSWRIDASGISEGGTFIGDELNVASNGFYAYVPFKMEPGKKYILYDDTHDDGGSSWLNCYTDQSSVHWQAPTKKNQPTQFPGSEVGLDPNLTYVKMFVQSWIDDQWEPFVKQTHGDHVNLAKIEDWIQYGYRETTLALQEVDGREPVSTMRIRQWLPMPVWENENTNPLNANLYYSRIDVYEGVTLPWGPSGLNDKDLSADKLNKKNLHIHRVPEMDDGDKDFNPQYGFDMCVAIYHDDKYGDKLISYDEDEGRPNDALRTALFRAINCGSGQTTPTFPAHYDQFDHTEDFYRIGLPTVEEWEKIKQNGAVDPDFPIASDEYWTSSTEGTYSKAFSYFNGSKGSARSAKRDEKHRVRLIYHKNDAARSTNY